MNAVLGPHPVLALIDFQRVFHDPELGWGCPGYLEAEAHAEQIAQAIRARGLSVIRTRFVRDPHETGSWRAYYDRWNQFRLDPEDPIWDLTSPSDDTVVDRPTFGKWTEGLERHVDRDSALVVCGVATDCCVLSTVFSAIDAGQRVVVVEDACAGATPELHREAIRLIELQSPHVTTVSTSEVLRLLSADH
ncbi:cysteine hydrolase [Auritidibacter ignavus]|uniref:Cysteine hydrolase n=1 Tax=Auritidibacter ignavus TaxID=678932 RepID=A0AAJ6DC84_9MICC|nr:cysteine hydrolase [Auritidibacter ignavus]PXA76328.1 cysteine hydrolase [Auritidibacter sp. NML120779]WGH86234.1 cysteine hydrolase [Auritidibacter ignavus]WGH88518.1 cysteine hydrolase [Auritidibacter ignavus]WGH90836.1 cysteine hydrolase [Auritidibacter ignavus]WGH93209.1 cysteine hydrolase [Auritidibacter ignavus]